MPLTVADCIVTNNSITITFSDPVFQESDVKNTPNATSIDKNSAANLANYTVFDPGSVDFQAHKTAGSLAGTTLAKVSNRALTLSFVPSNGVKKEFPDGDWVNIVIRHVHGLSEGGDHFPELDGDFVLIARQVAGSGKTARIIRDAEDAIAYPILTEEVGYPPAADLAARAAVTRTVRSAI